MTDVEPQQDDSAKKAKPSPDGIGTTGRRRWVAAEFDARFLAIVTDLVGTRTRKPEVQGQEMTTIERLWGEYELPVKDALHYADGRSYDVLLNTAAPGGFSALSLFSVDDMLEDDPSWVSSVDGLASVDLGERGLLWGGEGSYGSEGFIARLTPDRALIWTMFFAESNPFDRIQLTGDVATFSSTAGFDVSVDIDDPRNPVPLER